MNGLIIHEKEQKILILNTEDVSVQTESGEKIIVSTQLQRELSYVVEKANLGENIISQLHFGVFLKMY